MSLMFDKLTARNPSFIPTIVSNEKLSVITILATDLSAVVKHRHCSLRNYGPLYPGRIGFDIVIIHITFLEYKPLIIMRHDNTNSINNRLES